MAMRRERARKRTEEPGRFAPRISPNGRVTRPRAATAIHPAPVSPAASYESLIRTAPFGYLLLNRSGVIQEVNDRAARMIGLPRQRLLGTPFTRFIADSDRETFNDSARQARIRLAHLETDFSLETHDGHQVPVHVSLQPAQNPN